MTAPGKRTYWHLETLGHKPSEYEIVTSRLLYYTARGFEVKLPPLEEGEYYHTDLIGLPCVDEGGNALGTVVAVENFGAGDLLEVERSDGRRSLIPFREPVARLDGERILLDPEFLA